MEHDNVADGVEGTDDLLAVLRRVEPSARLVEPRVLRRVVRRSAGLTGLGLDGPHADVFVAPVAHLRRWTDPDEVHTADLDGDALLILVAEPESADRGSEAWLRAVWRRLYHGRIDLAMRRLRERGVLDRYTVRRRVHVLGHAEFDEIHYVLWQEGRLLPPRDDVAVFCEFVAVFHEVRAFEPDALARLFPSLDGADAAIAMIGDLIDADALLARTRLADIAMVPPQPPTASMPPPEPPAPIAPCSPEDGNQRLAAARTAARHGNHVRSAILATRVRCCADADLVEAGRVQAHDAIGVLSRRIAAAVDGEAALGRLGPALERLVPWASRGVFSVEGRLLYDLQRACVEAEREVYRVDLWWWMSALGTIPLLRPLPGKRVVNVRRNLERARRRIDRCRLPATGRAELHAVLDEVVERATGRLRGYFAPRLHATFEGVGLTATHNIEAVALDKLVGELCDRIAARGFISIGDLRDGIARSHVKLQDVSTVREAWVGDALIRANKALGLTLDDVYRRAEIYLRLLQRSTTLAFGTPVGRWLVLFAALPFGGAYLILEGIYHILHPILGWVGVDFPRAITGPGPLLGVGLFLLALLHVPAVRSGVWEGLGFLGRGLRAVGQVPGWVLRRPWVQAVLHSRAARLVGRLLVKPIVYGGASVGVAKLVGDSVPVALWVGLATFLIVNLLLNSRVGRRFEELALDAVGRSWRRVWGSILPGVVRAIVDASRWTVESLERGLYAVDEWLRFRSTDSRAARWGKALGSVLWAVVTYLARIYVTLLIEPQVNPLKHFPVVTVSHKLMLPVAVPTTRAIASVLSPLGPFLSNTFAATTVTLIPGVFGFLAWELKENWRLFSANQSPTLDPVIVGAHGESMRQLLRPGLHSGTVPKLFRKLRRAERRGAIGRLTGRAARLRAQLAEAEEGVKRFVERELVALLRRSGMWTGPPLEVEVHAGANRIAVSLKAPDAASFDLAFEEHDGMLMFVLDALGWAETLETNPREVLRAALLGLCAMAGVEMVREHVRQQLPPDVIFDITHGRLVVWSTTGPLEASYVLDAPIMEPAPSGSGLPTLQADVLHARQRLRYEDWVTFWSGTSPAAARRTLLPGVEVLPPPGGQLQPGGRGR